MNKQKRKLFNEFLQGLDKLPEARVGKQTLRAHEVAIQPVPDLTAAEHTVGSGRQHALRYAEMLQVPISGNVS